MTTQIEHIALWAEVVPSVALMTVDDLHMLPDDGWVYELIEGVLVRMPMSGTRASSISTLLSAFLTIHVKRNGLGVVTGEQGGYRLDPEHPRETEVAPDVAFIRAERLPSPDSPAYDLAPVAAPDLAVEVASPNQHVPGMNAKAQFYLRFGTRLVWVIWPRYKRIDVWRPGDETPTALGVEDALDGEDVVPGFTFPIGDLFT